MNMWPLINAQSHLCALGQKGKQKTKKKPETPNDMDTLVMLSMTHILLSTDGQQLSAEDIDLPKSFGGTCIPHFRA